MKNQLVYSLTGRQFGLKITASIYLMNNLYALGDFSLTSAEFTTEPDDMS